MPVRIRAVIPIILIVAGWPVAASASTVPTVEVAVADVASARSPVVVDVTIRNDDAGAVHVLRRAFGADGLPADGYAITRDGAAVAYRGPIAKLGAPRDADYLVIPGHGSATFSVDVGHAYAFTAAGTYAIAADVRDAALVLDARGAVVTTTLASPTVVAWVAGREASAAAAPRITATARVGALSVDYSGCASGEQTTILTSLVNARAYAAEAVAYFGDRRAGARYTTWFGAYDATRWSRVHGNYTRALDALDTGAITVVCHDPSCTGSTFAFVFPNNPYRVFVCGGYWSAPATGTDSKAGTMIHEFMHFTGVAGTDDWVYGQTDAAALAAANPGRAIDNSDNHEYFVENTPSVADNALAVTVDTTSHAFGSVTVGAASAAHTVTVRNTGDAALTLGSIVSQDPFPIELDACSSRILAAGASCAFTMRFAPTTAAAASASVAIPTDAVIAADAIAVTGTGTPAVDPVPAPAPAPSPVASTTSIASPTTQTRIAVRVAARPVRGGLRVEVRSTDGPRQFRLQVRRAARWSLVPGVYALERGVRTVRLKPGLYRVVTTATATHAAGSSAPVRVLAARG